MKLKCFILMFSSWVPSIIQLYCNDTYSNLTSRVTIPGKGHSVHTFQLEMQEIVWIDISGNQLFCAFQSEMGAFHTFHWNQLWSLALSSNKVFLTKDQQYTWYPCLVRVLNDLPNNQHYELVDKSDHGYELRDPSFNIYMIHDYCENSMRPLCIWRRKVLATAADGLVG